MNKWRVEQTRLGNWAVLAPDRDGNGWRPAHDLYPPHMWAQAFACAWEHAVFEGLGVVGVEVTS